MRLFLLTILYMMFLLSCQTEALKPEVKTEAPDSESAVFAAGLVSTDLYERDLAISPDGRQLIYSLGDYKQRKRCLVKLDKLNDSWTGKSILEFSGEFDDIEPFFAPDGKRLYFASDRPVDGDTTRVDYNIWYVESKDSGWSDPIALDTVINKKGNEFYPSLSNNGNLYFTAIRRDGIGLEDIFVSKFKDGKFQPTEVLDTAINSPTYEFNAFISPNEDLLVFSSFGRPDGLGGGDLYVSQKDKSGQWMKAKNMGALINSDKLDYCPFIDFNKNTFYYTSERSTRVNQKMTLISEMENFARSVQNGMGDIYHIRLSTLNLNRK